MNRSAFQFTLDFEVRDYECDLQGIVNNSVYLNYLEHARHAFLKQHGVDFARLAHEGINLVVVRVEIDYLRSLGSGDRFAVGVAIEPVTPLRLAFVQAVFRYPDDELIVRARTIGTGVNAKGRPAIPESVRALLRRNEAAAEGRV